MSQLFTSGDQSIGPSVSAPVLPMNIQDSFPLGLSYLITVQFKGLSRGLEGKKNIFLLGVYTLIGRNSHGR